MSFPDEHLPEEEGVVGEAGPESPPEDAPAESGEVEEADAVEAGEAAEATEVAEGMVADAREVDPMDMLTRERDEYLLALQRTQADFENYRKRIARQQEEQSARAAADLVSKLLPVLDTLDLAEAHLNETLDLTEDGKALRASRAMLMDILSREGLERVDQAGVSFDPSVHDAVAHSAGDGSEGGTVVEEVMRSGYRWKGQPLRPAMVRVRG
jgi:molecular chaperone GrpE